jgi:hypothetical protein
MFIFVFLIDTMKIIAVNIRHNIHTVSTIIGATRRAWLLNQAKANSCDYVIGVSNGTVRGYFKLHSVHTDIREPNRVAFKLTNCDSKERRIINASIRIVNLSRFVTKYI